MTTGDNGKSRRPTTRATNTNASKDKRRAHVSVISLGSVPATAPGRVAQSRAGVLRLRRVGGDLPPFRPVLPLGDPSRRVDHVARSHLVS